MDDFPEIPEDLLKALKKRFPDKSSSLSDSIEEIRFHSGEVNVIRFLETQLKLQQNKE